jgi:predicted alpha/beta-hydrolase family hydrolase
VRHQSLHEIAIEVPHPQVDRVAGVLHEPQGERRARAVLLAHGAGSDMDSPFLVAIASGLAARGFAVLRFRYPYMELCARAGSRRPPDAATLLEAAHSAALAELARRVRGERPLLAGKSLGGRIGTHLAAKGADASGLVLLGYPLHPPRKPERERSEHFPAIVQPALFLQGTRDALCDLARLERALAHFGGRATLSVVEGADHSFAVPARSGRTPDQVRSDLVERIDAWERREFPA